MKEMELKVRRIDLTFELFHIHLNERLVQVHFTITDDSFNFIFRLVYWIYQASLPGMEWKKNSCHLFDVFLFLTKRRNLFFDINPL